jgi:Flp pilus assembly protein TadG
MGPSAAKQGKEKRARPKKRLGQSLVEFTILLPVLMMMLSGLVEFGFALNHYLDLVDSAREVARLSADDDPIHDDTTAAFVEYNGLFYARALNYAKYNLSQARQLTLDESSDDLVISVFAVTGTTVTARYPTPFTDTDALRPTCMNQTNGGEMGWRAYCNHVSKFSSADVSTLLGSMPSLPPNTGVVLVEVFFDYHMVLGLPWITAFVNDPIELHAYSLYPNVASEPTPTP